MTKKVKITIKGSQYVPDSDEEFFELVTDGEYVQNGSRAEVSYIESELTGYNGLKTTFIVEPDMITLSRAGGAAGDMLFTVGRKQHFLFESGYGSITMGIDTHSISSDLGEDDGQFEIRYDVDVNNAIISRNEFLINFVRDEGNIWQQ